MNTLDLTQLKVNDVMYYGASINWIPKEHRHEIYGWIMANFGRGVGDLTTAPIWFAHEDYFWFRYEEDRSLFILRWS